MIAPTHVLGGVLSYFVASWWKGHPPELFETLIAGFVALLPDLDHKKSLISRLIPLPEKVRNLFGLHRTVTHSLIAIIAVWLVTRLLPDGIALAIVSAYVSHILLDLITKSGVYVLWPSGYKFKFPGNEKYRIKVGGPGELGFALFLVIMMIPGIWLAHHNAGFLGTVRDMIGDLHAAREHFDHHRDEADWWLSVRGVHNQTYHRIDGRYKVIGNYRGRGLILQTLEGPRSVCRSNDCDWFASRAVIRKGPPVQTSAKVVRTPAISAEALRDLLRPYIQIGEVYLIGQLQVEGIRAEPPTISVSNTDQVTLNFAQPHQIWQWSGRITEVSLTIQIRHKPGTQVPRLEVPPPPEEPPDPSVGIHPLMRPYFPDWRD